MGATVKVAGPDGVTTLPVPDGVGLERPSALPEGAVRTTYERMTTFGVEYGPYVRLAETFRDLIEGKQVVGPAAGHFRRRRRTDGGARGDHGVRRP